MSGFMTIWPYVPMTLGAVAFGLAVWGIAIRRWVLVAANLTSMAAMVLLTFVAFQQQRTQVVIDSFSAQSRP